MKSPLRYIHRPIPRTTLAALLRGSNVGLVSPLRDGMNLVAKEYVAAQDHDDPGVVVLSKFAGAAEEMKEALIINPYDIDDMAQNLQRALTPSLTREQPQVGQMNVFIYPPLFLKGTNVRVQLALPWRLARTFQMAFFSSSATPCTVTGPSG